MNRELIPQLDPLVDRLNEWRGSLVEVVEQVTRSPGTLDRHFTTRSSFVMRLEFVGIAFSGASLMVLGKAFDRDVGYQATCDLLEHLSVAPDEVIVVERFAKVADAIPRSGDWVGAKTPRGASPDQGKGSHSDGQRLATSSDGSNSEFRPDPTVVHGRRHPEGNGWSGRTGAGDGRPVHDLRGWDRERSIRSSSREPCEPGDIDRMLVRVVIPVRHRGSRLNLGEPSGGSHSQ